MPINVNCRHYDGQGGCIHGAAPPRLFGRPGCVLIHRPSDPRLSGCNLIEEPIGYGVRPPPKPSEPAPIQAI